VRLATPLAVLALAAALLGGCGSSGEEISTGPTVPPKTNGAEAPIGASTQSCILNLGGVDGLRANGVSCGKAQKVALSWRRNAACSADPNASRSSCTVDRYRCLATRTGHGLAVSCSRPKQAIAFTVER
jgi:hypothetical protein